MPTDSSIPLQVRPPQTQSVADQFGKLLTLKHMLDASKLNAAHLEAYGLENEQRRQTMGADKALADLMTQNTKQAPDGSPVRDDAAIVNGLTSRGYGNRALKYVDDMRAQRTAQLANEKTALDTQKEQIGLIAQGLGAVTEAPDPQKQAVYTQVRNDLNSRGLIKNQALFPEIYDPQFVATHTTNALTAQQQMEKKQHQLTYQLDLDKFANTKEEQAPKNLADWTKTTGQLLGEAPDQAHWTAALALLKAKGAPASLLSQFGPEFSTDQLDRANSLGMTSTERSREQHQIAQEEHAQANEELRGRQLDQQNKRIDALIDQGQQRTDTARDLADWRMAGGTTGAKKLTGNQFSSLMRDEGKLNRERRLLGVALAKGDAYVDRQGNVTTDKPTNTQKQAMVQRYLESGDELKKLIAVKNNHLASTGSKVGVSTDQATAAIDAGEQKLHGDMLKNFGEDEPGLGFGPVSSDTEAPTAPAAPPKAAPRPPAKPQSTSPPKAPQQFKYTEDQVRTRAKAAGVDPEAAVAQARSKKLIQ